MLKRAIGIVVLCAAAGLLLQADKAYAQREFGRTRGMRHEGNVVTLPRDRDRMVVGGREYFYSRGVFYRMGPRGYVAIRGPVGARVRILPSGFLTVRIGGVPFFYYYGTYYQYDPASRVYVVTQPPAEGHPPQAGPLDKIDFIDGHTLEGTFVGGTDSTVQFNVNGEIQEFPIAQISSVVFAPPVQ